MPRLQDAASPRRRPTRRRWLLMLLLAALGLLLSGCQDAQGASLARISVEASGDGQPVSTGVQLLVLLTLLSLAPSAMIMVTSFTRIVIVLSFLRSAIGVPNLPPNQVVLGLSIFLSVFVMAPVWQGVNSDALQPLLRKEIAQDEALNRVQKPLRTFMLRQVRERDLALMVSLAKAPRPRTVDDVPTHVLIPAFIISELKTAFQMGFVIFIPFLIIDMVVSSSLMSMGMMMLPPVMISLPLKLLLFVLVDGWNLVVGMLLQSFGAPP